MVHKKSTLNDIAILEELPPLVDLALLKDRFGHYRHPRKKIFDLSKHGVLEHITRGQYLNLRTRNLRQIPIERIANTIYFPSYVSAEWALQYNGILTEGVQVITSVTPRKSAFIRTSLGDFEFRHLHKHRYAFGYIIQPGQDFMMARPEKALLDYLNIREHFETWNSAQELEEYLVDHLRIKLPFLLQQTSSEHLNELLPHYHRNSKEYRCLKFLLKLKKGSPHAPSH